MKKKIVLISCVSKKETEACKAKDMYLSPLFKMSWEYAKQFSPDKVFILSAKHHLLDPEQRIDPYNVTLYTFAAAERKAWAQRVLSGLEAAGLDLEHDEFVLLAGKKYYEYLLGEGGIRNFTLPLHGHGGIGCILKYLKEQTSKL